MYHLFKGVKFNSVNMAQTVDIIRSYLVNSYKSHYICMTDVGNIVNAFRKNEILKIETINRYVDLRFYKTYISPLKLLKTGKI